jgi:inner membrane protein
VDNLTHSLAGAALAKAGLERYTPLAATTLVLAANAPDVDILAYAQGPYFALSFRRGITHGVLATVVLPFLVAGAVLAWDRWVRRRGAPDAMPANPRAVLMLAFVGLLTHPALDWMNNYGMRWWLPFDGRWSYGDAFFILDPWLWLALGIAVYLGSEWARSAQIAWAVLALLASALIAFAPVSAAVELLWFVALVLVANVQARGRPSSTHGRRRLAAALCIGTVLYALEMIVSSELGRRDVSRAASDAGLVVEDIMVAPVAADPLGGDVVIRTPEGYIRGTHHWLGAPRTRLERVLLPYREATSQLSSAELERAVDEAKRDSDAMHFLDWARFPYYRVTPGTEGLRVRISDVRYDGRGGGSLARGLAARAAGGLEVVVSDVAEDFEIPSGSP